MRRRALHGCREKSKCYTNRVTRLRMRKNRSRLLKANQASSAVITRAVLDYINLLLKARPVEERVNQREDLVTHYALVGGYTRDVSH